MTTLLALCAPKILLPSGTVRGQIEPCLTVTDPGYPIIVNQDLPADLVYRLAQALNESSPAHWASEDIFYSTRHAPRATRRTPMRRSIPEPRNIIASSER